MAEYLLRSEWFPDGRPSRLGPALAQHTPSSSRHCPWPAQQQTASRHHVRFSPSDGLQLAHDRSRPGDGPNSGSRLHMAGWPGCMADLVERHAPCTRTARPRQHSLEPDGQLVYRGALTGRVNNARLVATLRHSVRSGQRINRDMAAHIIGAIAIGCSCLHNTTGQPLSFQLRHDLARHATDLVRSVRHVLWLAEI